MIYINDFSREFELTLHSLCKGSPYGARILAYYTAYCGKKYDFLDFWIQRSADGRELCALCRYYSALIICGACEDKGEIEDFVSMLNPSSIFCDGTFELHTSGGYTEGETMKFCRTGVDCSEVCKIIKIGSDIGQLREVYNLLASENSRNDVLPDFEGYFLDISHRIRHSVSEVYAVLNDEEKIIATAAVVAMADNCAVIGCVATHRSFRRQGIATNLVGRITKSMLEDKREVYLHRERKIGLYDKLGYVTIGEWREYYNGLYHT